MLESNIQLVKSDMKTLISDAQSLLQAAAALTGDKADELRGRGMKLLETAVSKAQVVQTQAVEKGKVLAVTTDDYVKQNPWRAVAISAGIGVLAGVLLSRR